MTLCWGLALLGLAVITWLLVHTGVTDGLDDSLKGFVTYDGFWHWNADGIAWTFSFWPMVGASLVFVGTLAFKGYRRAAAWVAALMALDFVLTPLLQALVGRPRPPWQDTLGLIHAHTAFPSGHVMHSTVFFGIAIALTRIFIRKKGVRRLLTAACTLVILLVAVDRLVLGRHHLTDVVAAILIGSGLVLIGLAAYSPIPLLTVVPQPLALPAAPAHDRRCAVVLNPIKVDSVGAFQATVSEIALASGWEEPRYYLTTVDDSGTGQAAQAAVDGAALVLVCGGDGTVREVCAELAGTGISVGVIPAGTGNLLARNLALPLYLRSAVDVAFNGQDRAIDMVEVSGDNMEDSHFLVMAGMGFDAAIMEGANETVKAKIGWLAYVLSGMRALMFPAVKVEISIDGGEFTKHRARTIVVGNVGTLTAGMPLIPDASIDDGLLDVVLLHPQRFWSWVPLAFRILAKRPHIDDTINRFTGREVIIRADRETPRQLDGDPVGEGKELIMRNIHGRLLIRVAR
ncbi:YegS/Rv2252/BmrU family lipid kinase [Nocardioides sp. Kera G14]|uniref:YegS/Rv2252/BmrU family lipid kinase n=1 Tax=Nocardioides sp. Kera G14 TaxID=2884264 RepID=UPI001D12BC8E|nr:YegS/Rv2252/BmrU family lipid kinase [Nocardioides sp. Kera G14]UDY23352.1 YegS/Rv2252/BmrU family lipid kinase [Nocardioides sp. Kera G14]